ncbi:hypothetical protein B566_EDAN016206 [Ephemera danica]|nr:hypothetical protein B566_EDAN016206 [Ephemera danica]
MLLVNIEQPPEHQTTHWPCLIQLEAPENYKLGVSYLRIQPPTERTHTDTSCPLRMILESKTFNGQVSSVCEQLDTSGFPRLFPRRLQLTINNQEWPVTKISHRLVFTAVGIAYVAKQWHGMHPTLCVSRQFACDGVNNCPLSGADENPVLCGNNSATVVPTSWTSDDSDKLTLFERIIHKAAAQAAANLTLKNQKNQKNYSANLKSTEGNDTLILLSCVVSISILVIVIVIATVIIWKKRQTLIRFLGTWQRWNSILPQNDGNTVENSPHEGIEVIVQKTPSFQREDEEPPNYNSLFPEVPEGENKD